MDDIATQQPPSLLPLLKDSVNFPLLRSLSCVDHELSSSDPLPPVIYKMANVLGHLILPPGY